MHSPPDLRRLNAKREAREKAEREEEREIARIRAKRDKIADALSRAILRDEVSIVTSGSTPEAIAVQVTLPYTDSETLARVLIAIQKELP